MRVWKGKGKVRLGDFVTYLDQVLKVKIERFGFVAFERKEKHFII